jgi:hypothetical protein
MAVVYKHTRMDNGLPFYIGIGKTIKRAKSKSERNKYWHNIVNKYGYNIEILHTNISWEEACELEKQYIKQYGRSDLGLGPLVNMTDGGDGISNISDITREKMSKCKIGKKASDETKRKLSKSKTGINNPFFNKKHTDFTIKKMSEIKIGKKQTEESNIKRSIKLKNRQFSDITKAKISKAKKGEKHHLVKLIENDIKNIRKEYSNSDISQYKLGLKYGVSRGTIHDIIHRKTWKHI